MQWPSRFPGSGEARTPKPATTHVEGCCKHRQRAYDANAVRALTTASCDGPAGRR